MLIPFWNLARLPPSPWPQNTNAHAKLHSIQPPHSLQGHWKSSDMLQGKGRQLHYYDPSFFTQVPSSAKQEMCLRPLTPSCSGSAPILTYWWAKSTGGRVRRKCFLVGYHTELVSRESDMHQKGAEPASCEQQLRDSPWCWQLAQPQLKPPPLVVCTVSGTVNGRSETLNIF